MSQYVTRFHILAKNMEIWKYLEKKSKKDEGMFYGLDRLRDHHYIYDEEGGMDEKQLLSMVRKLCSRVGGGVIVIADTTNINVDNYSYIVYYLGDKVHHERFSYGKKADICSNSDIYNICAWLTDCDIELNDQEKEHLLSFNIIAINHIFKEINYDIDLPDISYLRETGSKNRAKYIEECKEGDEVILKPMPLKSEPNRIEVFYHRHSIGYLYPQTGELLMPLMAANKIIYKAMIGEVVPLSKRNPLAKSPIVGIKIGAKLKTDEIL